MCRFIKEYLLIKKSGYFDSHYYLLNYPDVRKADVAPLVHYVSKGWKEGRRPSEQFDPINFSRIDGNDTEINPLVNLIQIENKRAITSKREFIKTIFSVLKALNFFLNIKGVVVFGGYPYPERERDGYYQRIRAIDTILNKSWRIYIDNVDLPGRDSWYDFPAEKTLVLRPNKHKFVAKKLMALCVLRCRVIYFHSILSISKINLLWKLPGITKILDFHGVVPEELELQGDIVNSKYFSEIEHSAIKRVDYIVVVSTAMRHHIEKKYNGVVDSTFITLPIFQDIPNSASLKTYPNEKPLIIYAGGLQKWQQVPKMIDAIDKTVDFTNTLFLCPHPEEILEILPERLRHHPSLEIGSKSSNEILEVYSKCHYGYILREDIIVNKVACPTKLMEYLATGIVPIVDCENIGDFNAMGMQYVKIIDLLNHRLPDEQARQMMVEHNFLVYRKFKEQYLTGAKALNDIAAHKIIEKKGETREKNY